MSKLLIHLKAACGRQTKVEGPKGRGKCHDTRSVSALRRPDPAKLVLLNSLQSAVLTLSCSVNMKGGIYHLLCSSFRHRDASGLVEERGTTQVTKSKLT